MVFVITSLLLLGLSSWDSFPFSFSFFFERGRGSASTIKTILTVMLVGEGVGVGVLRFIFLGLAYLPHEEHVRLDIILIPMFFCKIPKR